MEGIAAVPRLHTLAAAFAGDVVYTPQGVENTAETNSNALFYIFFLVALPSRRVPDPADFQAS